MWRKLSAVVIAALIGTVTFTSPVFAAGCNPGRIPGSGYSDVTFSNIAGTGVKYTSFVFGFDSKIPYVVPNAYPTTITIELWEDPAIGPGVMELGWSVYQNGAVYLFERLDDNGGTVIVNNLIANVAGMPSTVFRVSWVESLGADTYNFYENGNLILSKQFTFSWEDWTPRKAQIREATHDLNSQWPNTISSNYFWTAGLYNSNYGTNVPWSFGTLGKSGADFPEWSGTSHTSNTNNYQFWDTFCH